MHMAVQNLAQQTSNIISVEQLADKTAMGEPKIQTHQKSICSEVKPGQAMALRHKIELQTITTPQPGRVLTLLTPPVVGWFFLIFCVTAVAQSAWFTIVGDPGDIQTDLVEVDPQSRSLNAGNAILNIRVSRAILRTSSDGVPFRSYTATVLVDCSAKSARFVNATFYMMPLWEGRPHTSLTYSATEVRPVLFRSIEPNPAAKIIRAACQMSSP